VSHPCDFVLGPCDQLVDPGRRGRRYVSRHRFGGLEALGAHALDLEADCSIGGDAGGDFGGGGIDNAPLTDPNPPTTIVDGPDGNPVFTNLTPTVPTVPDSPTYADDMLQNPNPH
jgi:hypothetical protein